MAGWLIPVSQLRKPKEETVKIGNTLFVNGTPYTVCANCDMPIRLHDSKKISIGFWVKKEELVLDPITKEVAIEVKNFPKIHTAQGCNDCWTKQDNERQHNRHLGVARAVFYLERK